MPGEYANFAMRAVSLGRKRGRPPVLSANAFYPFAAERRLAALLKAELARSVRESLASALGRLSDDVDGDGWTEEFLSGTDRAASEIVLNAREAFSRFSEMTVGTPYYPPDAEARVKDDWKAEFLACCKSADADAKADIARALTEAKEKGWNRAQAEAAVLERLDPKYAKRAELIARTETGKLNNAATMATYRSAGVEYYVWLATPDERTRPAHAALNGKICAVGDPDHWYEDNPDDPLRPLAHGRSKEMYHGDPGTDFQCRCTSVPWDPRIDSRYRVRNVPEPERKPTELETARAEAETARREREETETALKNAENAKRAAEKKTRTIEGRYRETVSIMQASEKEAKKLRKAAERKEKALESLDRENSRMAARLSEMEAKARFPEEEWEILENVHVAKTRLLKGNSNKNEKEKFSKELLFAKYLQRHGSHVWLLPELGREEKYPDAIVDGLIVDFKETNFKHIEKRFLEAIEQAGNACIRIEDKDVSIERIFGKLKKHARNKRGVLMVVLNNVIYKRDFGDL